MKPGPACPGTRTIGERPAFMPVTLRWLAVSRERDECSRSMNSAWKPALRAMNTISGEVMNFIPSVWMAFFSDCDA